MTEEQPVVFVIDDDASVREALEDLLRSVGIEVRSFRSAQDFMRSERQDAPGCLVLDVRLPGLSGLEFQRELVKSGSHLPIIFLTAHADIPMTVAAMKSGAVEFLTKPFREQELLDAIQLAIERDRTRRRDTTALAEVQKRFEALTSREREVMGHVVVGRVNKQIAADLDVSEMTVKIHRSHVMQKMQARSLVDLIHMADRLGLVGRTLKS